MGFYYVMWQAQIGYSDEINDVEDRGSFTANHCDHIHLAFNESIDFRPGDVTPWDDAPEPDAGPPPEDSGPTPEDTGPPPEDTGPTPEDTGPEDADPDPVDDADPDPVDDADPPPRQDGGIGEAPMNGLAGGCGVSPARGRVRLLSRLLAPRLAAAAAVR